MPLSNASFFVSASSDTHLALRRRGHVLCGDWVFSLKASLTCCCCQQGVDRMGGLKPPKLKVEDEEKTYIQR